MLIVGLSTLVINNELVLMLVQIQPLRKCLVLIKGKMFTYDQAAYEQSGSWGPLRRMSIAINGRSTGGK